MTLVIISRMENVLKEYLDVKIMMKILLRKWLIMEEVDLIHFAKIVIILMDIIVLIRINQHV